MLSPQTRKISQLDREPDAVPDLAGALLEMSVPKGPVQGGYVSRAITTEQFAANLPGGAPGPNLPTFDLLDLTTDQMQQVMSLPYADCDAAPADSPAWSRPGHQFDAIDSQGRNCHFYCTRGTYDPRAPAGTTGIGPAWHYTLKLG